MKTQQTYLEDTYKVETNSKILQVLAFQNASAIISESTIFYPQGGGQASDLGTISCNGKKIPIHKVVWVEGEIYHLTHLPHAECQGLVGTTCSMTIDSERRIVNAKLHSSGHLIDDILKTYFPDLRIVKGHHFPGEAYVSCEGKIEDTDVLLSEVNRHIQNAVASKIPIVHRTVEGNELLEILSTLPYSVPTDKPLRVLTIGTASPVPCGGTHVNNTSELDGLKITKIKNKAGMLKFSYKVDRK